MARYEIIPGRGRVRCDNSFCGAISFSSSGSSYRSERPAPKMSAYDRELARVEATGNKWAIENFHATHD